MRDLQEEIWNELKDAVEAFQKAFEENVDIGLINSLAEKVKELEKRLVNLNTLMAGYFYPLQSRPEVIVRMHLAETPEFV